MDTLLSALDAAAVDLMTFKTTLESDLQAGKSLSALAQLINDKHGAILQAREDVASGRLQVRAARAKDKREKISPAH
jgi:hypothetical protein